MDLFVNGFRIIVYYMLLKISMLLRNLMMLGMLAESGCNARGRESGMLNLERLEE